MRRRRRDTLDWLPPVTPSPEAVRHARALAEHLREGGDLPIAPVPDLHPGEVGHAFWPTGFQAAVYDRHRGSPYVPPAQGWFIADPRRYGLMAAAGTLLGRTPRTYPKGCYWQPIASGHPIALAITSHRLQLGTGDSLPFVVLTSVRQIRDNRVLRIEAAGQTLCIWGEHTSHAAVLLDYLLDRDARRRQSLRPRSRARRSLEEVDAGLRLRFGRP